MQIMTTPDVVPVVADPDAGPAVNTGPPGIGDAEGAAAAAVAPPEPVLSSEATDENFKKYAELMQIMRQELNNMRQELRESVLKSTSLEKELLTLKAEKDKEKDTEDKDKDKDEIRPLKQLDRKDVDKPEKYGGNTDNWLRWSKQFKKFLRRNDSRWGTLLELIEKNAGKPVTPELEGEWAVKAGIGDHMNDFKAQLNEYLESYTTGAVKTLVEACADRKALDAWRQMADKGHSMRAAHVHVLRKKAFFPKTNVPTKDLENSISNWEADIERFESATGESEKLPEPNRRMSLIDMCTETLRKHLKALEHVKVISYEELKVEIADWIAESEVGKAPGLKAMADADRDQQPDGNDWDFDITVEDAENATHAELLALVKNKFAKKGKGKGSPEAPRAPADHSGKTCYDCGETGHVGADCPVRKARVAAGGPERLPRDPKGGGKRGKKGGGGGWQPNKTTWKSWFPGPTQAQWSSWFPSKGDGKGGKGEAFAGQGHQLKSFAPADNSWLFQPGYCMSFTEKKPEQKKPEQDEKPMDKSVKAQENKSFEHKNGFEALREEDDGRDAAPPLLPDVDERGVPVPCVPIPGARRVRCGCCPEAADDAAKSSRARRDKRRMAMYDLYMKEMKNSESKATKEAVEEIVQDKATEKAEEKTAAQSRRRRWMKLGVSGAMGVPTDETHPVETPVRDPKEQPKAPRTPPPSSTPQTKAISIMDEHFPPIGEWNTVLRKRQKTPTTKAWHPTLAPLIERRPQTLNPLQENGMWEYFEAILDSGASVTVVPPSLAKEYEVVEGEASKAGVKYEIANGDEIPNLGEKLMPIMTNEGTTRGLRAQVADVSKPLQAVRSLVRSGHAVIFGDGDNGDCHYVVNKMTGEVNMVKDDGVNYLMGMYVIPKAEMQAAGFGRPVTQP